MKAKELSPYVTLLQKHGYRVTPGRIALLTFLSDAKSPLTTLDIQKKMSYKMDKVTLYRALEDFSVSKIVAKINVKDTAAYYEFLHHDHHHHHIICEKCGNMEHMEICNQPTIEKEILKHSKNFTVVTSHALEFFGICKSCNK